MKYLISFAVLSLLLTACGPSSRFVTPEAQALESREILTVCVARP